MVKRAEAQKRSTVKKPKAVTVSPAQQLKQHNAELALENTRLLDETQRHAQEITTMAEIGREISASLDLAIVLERIASRAMELLRARDVVLRLLEPDGRLPAAVALGKYADIYRDWHAHLGQGLSGSVAQTGIAEIINDPENDPRVIDIPGTEQDKATRAILFAPMLIGEAVIGVLSVWRDKVDAGPFTQADLDFGLSLARQAAIAIQNARLYAETQQSFKETEILRAANVALTESFDLDTILGVLLDYLQQLVPYDTGSVFLMEDENHLTALATRGYEQWVENPAEAIGISFDFKNIPHIRTVIEDQTTFVIPDVTQHPGWVVAETAKHIRNWLAVPLVAGGKTIGMYSLDKVEPGYFTPEHQRLAENLASQAAIAFQNARLYRNEQAARKQAETLHAAALALGSTLSLQKVFELILSELRKVVPYDSCSVQQLDGNTMVIVGGHGFPNLDELLGLRFPTTAGDLSSHVINTRQPHIVDDVSASIEHFRNREHGLGRIHGWLGVPLIFGERLIGMLALDKHEAFFYTPKHAQVAMAFATQAATAIENARLFETEQLARKQAETLHAAALALGSTLSLRQVFELILSELRKVVPYDSCTVQQLDGNTMVIVGGNGFPNLDELLGNRFDWRGPDDPAGDVVRRRETVIIADVSARFEHFKDETHGQGRVHGWMGVPLLFGERLIGMLTLDKLEQDYYTSEHAHMAQAFATQAATAIENARLFDETQRLLKETEDRAQELAIINSVSEAMASSLDMKTVTYKVGDKIRDIFNTEIVDILMYDEKSRMVTLAYSYFERYFEDEPPWEISEGGLTSRIILNCQPLLLNNSQEINEAGAAAYVTAPDESDVQSYLGVPIMVGDKAFGMIDVQSFRQNAFNKNNLRLLQTLSSNIGIALENARLFKTEQLAREQAETLRAAALALGSTLSLQGVFELILSELRKVVPYDSCSVQQLDGNEMVIVGGHGFPNLDELLGNRFDWRAQDDPAGDVVRRREPVIIADVSARFEHFQDETHGQGRVHGWLGVPLLFGERMIGMITLDKLEKDFYTAEHAHMAQAFATQAATAIENARLFDETQRLLKISEDRTAELEAISKVSQALIAEAALDSTIQLIGSQMREIFNADIVYLALLDPQTNLIHFPYQFGESFTTLNLGEGLTSKIIQTGEPLLINSDVNERTLEIGASPVGREALSYLGVPIKTGKGTIGVISVQSTTQEGIFTDDSLRLLTTIAANAGAALHNAQLFSEALENLRQVEILTNAASAIEQSAYEPAMIESVAARTDALGELARVFAKMADEVRLREQRLKRQLAQMQLDIEEKRLAKAETVAIYIPMDRRQAMAQHVSLPEVAHGTSLFADVSGFTTLTESLANELGLQRGAEEMIRHLNRVFTALIDEVHRYSGAVINFSGDAITCWFDDLDLNGNLRADSSVERAATCAFAMQQGMTQFAAITTPNGKTIGLSIKVALAAGPARRMVVGDGTPHQIDVLAGATLSALADAEHFANKDEIILSAEGISSLEDTFRVSAWREEKQFAVLAGLRKDIVPSAWAPLANDAIPESQLQPWMHPAVFEKVRASQSDMLSELRPATALFMKFGGLDYDNEPEAGAKLNQFIQWVEQVIAPHNGSIIQFTVGDKGSYIYIVFGAPIAHTDDAAQAVFTALELAAPPESLSYMTDLFIGLASGQMRVGAYGGSSHRTYGAIGDRTNLAARLMVAASLSSAEIPDGQRAIILCNDSIYDAAKEQVEFESMPPINVKGKTETIAIYRPLRKLVEVNADSGITLERAQLIDNLTPAEQLTLKVASVIGQLFTLESLSAIYPEEHTRETLQTHLQILTGSDLIDKRPNESSSYNFKDPQTHEAAYNLMLFAQRRQLHRAVAEMLEQTIVSAPPYAEIAHHWQSANEIPKAVQYLEKAGEHARQNGDFEEATRFFNESLALNIGG